MEFVAIDVETANPKMSSICQIGIVSYRDGVAVHEWQSLINPQTHFDSLNIRIHGISDIHVADAPCFRSVYPTIASLLEGRICVSHTPFDRISIEMAQVEHGLPELNGAQWLDSARVARRTWEECAYRGYGLANVAAMIGHQFRHHDALEDAKAAGAIMLAAIAKTEISIEKWLKKVERRIKFAATTATAIIDEKPKAEPNPEGQLYGQSVVFTGQMTIPRPLAAHMALEAGLTVSNSVSKKTDYLVVGDQDITKLAGKTKSSKHIKAEQLIETGTSIRIIGESDFTQLVQST